jgi:hypothetical protein
MVEAKGKLEDVGGKGDLFHLEQQLSNLQEKFQIMKIHHMDNKN